VDCLKWIKWEAPEALPPGKHTLEFDFKYDGLGMGTLAFNSLSGLGRSGTGVLKVDGKEVARQTMERTIPLALAWDENLDVGSDTGTPVDDRDYQVPFTFTGQDQQDHADRRPAEAHAGGREEAHAGAAEQQGERIGKENVMTTRVGLFALALALLVAGVAVAQYPIMDMMAERVIQKYQNSTCEQLWEARGKPKSQQEQELIQLLRGDPQMRANFINKIAAPVANKMFECGLIP